MEAHAEINRSRSKKKPFRVKLLADNGEPIQTPQLLTTRNNVRKNLVSVINLCKGQGMWVDDHSGKERETYYLTKEGKKQSVPVS